MYDLEALLKKAKETKQTAMLLSSEEKNKALNKVADLLEKESGAIIKANRIDMENAEKSGMSDALKDRLRLNDDRIHGIADGIRKVALLPDPIGDVLKMWKNEDGLLIGQKRVPIGVIGIIYESRPNVTADTFSLVFKTGNVTVLRGGSDCINSNIAMVRVIKDALDQCGIDENVINLVEDTDREIATALMKADEYLDLLIPRGGQGLISSVIRNATVPVIQTGTGNCHIYVDKDADIDMAVRIIRNAKLQRLGVCNACESLVIHKDIAEDAIPVIAADLASDNVEIRGDKMALEASNIIVPANDEDYGTEYLAKIISVKVVDSIDDAISHINRYSTGHSEAIITDSFSAAQKFLDEIDSACVYVNASTRFTDGGCFGFGAEVGISTQKLHARGPMGLNALTSTKYIIYGNGQVRP